ncbi:MAG: hypothetical protein PHF79_00500 [Candidatus Pacebacteria bacterium]|nr:hypothetical protein [Candidatus Paceibacterota bacterium]
MQKAIDFIHKVDQVIVNPLILLMFAVALLVFLWGVFEFVRSSDSDDARATGQRHMLWGIVGLAIMISAFGIVNVIIGSIPGADRTGIDNITNQ